MNGTGGEVAMGQRQEDARIILKLYELRREETFRKARAWYAVEFEPASAADVVNLMRGGHRASAYYRMVTTYWEMAASLVTFGAVDEGLFHAANTEYLAVFAKIEPFIGEVRAAFGLPGYLSQLERVARAAPGAEEYFAKIRALMRRWAEVYADEATG